MTLAKGTFEVQLTPQSDEGFDAGRMTLDKSYAGDLKGTSKGQMLSVRTATEGSAGYVALEHVTATLEGKSGTFTLQHSGTMARGKYTLSVTVVPDSGTDALKGLKGDMAIIIKDGQHFYEFEYSLD